MHGDYRRGFPILINLIMGFPQVASVFFIDACVINADYDIHMYAASQIKVANARKYYPHGFELSPIKRSVFGLGLK